MPMTDDELRAWRAGLEGVTPGPWHQYPDDRNAQAVIGGEHIELFTCWHHSVGAIEKEMKANAAHIARCDPQTIATLLDEVLAGREIIDKQGNQLTSLALDRDRLRAENERLRDLMKELVAEHDKPMVPLKPGYSFSFKIPSDEQLASMALWQRARAALGKEG